MEGFKHFAKVSRLSANQSMFYIYLAEVSYLTKQKTKQRTGFGVGFVL